MGNWGHKAHGEGGSGGEEEGTAMVMKVGGVKRREKWKDKKKTKKVETERREEERNMEEEKSVDR